MKGRSVEDLLTHVKAASKYLLAFRRRQWELGDYPLRYVDQVAKGREPTGRLQLPRWHVQIINWWTMSGSGETPESALAVLTENFNRYRSEKPLPHPGTRVPLEIAATIEIEKRMPKLQEFASKVLGHEPGSYFVSDESSLWDFSRDDTLEPVFAKVRDVYGVDVSDVPGATIWKVLDRVGGPK
jgi:hypothetical protein